MDDNLDAVFPQHPDASGTEHRCCCGQLLARLTREGVELKCKRCRRLDVIPWTKSGGAGLESI